MVVHVTCENIAEVPLLKEPDHKISKYVFLTNEDDSIVWWIQEEQAFECSKSTQILDFTKEVFSCLLIEILLIPWMHVGTHFLNDLEEFLLEFGIRKTSYDLTSYIPAYVLVILCFLLYNRCFYFLLLSFVPNNSEWKWCLF